MTKVKKPTVLLVHGLRGDRHGLRWIGEQLSGDFEVLNIDLPGSGENPELEKQDLDGYIEWMHEYIGSLKRKPIVVAHSMGAIIASHYIEKYPETVDEKVVLLAPILRGVGGKAANRAFSGVVRGAVLPFTPKRRKKIMASKPVSWAISHYLTSDKTKQKIIDEEHYKYSGRFASAKSLSADIKISALYETKMPRDKRVLVVFGKKDRLSSYKLARERAKQAGAEYHEIETAGHLINYERPEEVAKRIKEFLSD